MRKIVELTIGILLCRRIKSQWATSYLKNTRTKNMNMKLLPWTSFLLSICMLFPFHSDLQWREQVLLFSLQFATAQLIQESIDAREKYTKCVCVCVCVFNKHCLFTNCKAFVFTNYFILCASIYVYFIYGQLEKHSLKALL